MSIDVDAITVALAGRFAPAQVAPPAGYTNIQGSFAYGPPAAAQLPLVVVNPPESGRMTFGGQERAAVHEFTVDVFLEGMADPARTAEATSKWLSVLLDQLIIAGAQLAGLVALAWIGRYETGELEYGGEPYPGIRLYVSITTTDGIAPVP
jgi:hypothetical protein